MDSINKAIKIYDLDQFKKNKESSMDYCKLIDDITSNESKILVEIQDTEK